MTPPATWAARWVPAAVEALSEGSLRTHPHTAPWTSHALCSCSRHCPLHSCSPLLQLNGAMAATFIAPVLTGGLLVMSFFVLVRACLCNELLSIWGGARVSGLDKRPARLPVLPAALLLCTMVCR